MKILKTILYVLLITGSIYSQKIYYVDNLLGTDLPQFGLKPGGQAWKTIEYAIDNVPNPEVDKIVIKISECTYNLMNNQIDINRFFNDLTLIGEGVDKTTIEAASEIYTSESRVIKVYPGNKVTLKHLTIRHGKTSPTDESGGGVLNMGGDLILDYCKVTDNTGIANGGGYGGGIANIDGNLTISNSSITNNVSVDSCYGGGIGSRNGSLIIKNTTISYNSAYVAGGLAIIAEGKDGFLTLENSTIYGNSADLRYGGIRISTFGLPPNPYKVNATINSCTIANNSATDFYGGLGIESPSEINIKNSIISGNTFNGSSPNDLVGTNALMIEVNSGGYNIVKSVFNVIINGDQNNGIGIDPQILPLAENNSVNGTQTCALTESSPARDMIKSADYNGVPLIDQRGYERDNARDIGSYELVSLSSLEYNPINGLKSYYLGQNYPNPFNPSTKINFNLLSEGNTKLTVYNLLGQEIEVLVNEFMLSGTHTINFDAPNLPSGIYLYKLESGGFTLIRKMTLVK